MRSSTVAALKYLNKHVTSDGFETSMSTEKSMKDSWRYSHEIFTSLMALTLHLRCCKDSNFVAKLMNAIPNSHSNGLFSYHRNIDVFSADVDNTSLGLAVLLEDKRIELTQACLVVDQILGNVTANNIFKVYLNNKSYLIDPVACINALYVIHLTNKHFHPAAKKTEEFIYKVLNEKSYHYYMHYYVDSEAFLYFLSRLVNRFPSRFEKFVPLLEQEIKLRMGAETNPLNAALRVIAANNLHMENPADLEKLKTSQSAEGNWGAYAFLTNGYKSEYYGSAELTTAFALKAMEPYAEKEKKVHVPKVKTPEVSVVKVPEVLPVKKTQVSDAKKIPESLVSKNPHLLVAKKPTAAKKPVISGMNHALANSQFGQASTTARQLRMRMGR